MYEKTRDEGLLKTVFWTREMSMADFIGMCQLAGNCLVFAFMGRECVGYAWLNGMSDNHAMAHFCLFKSIWGRRTEQVGKAILEHWFSFPGDDGPLFDTILGIVPGFNRRAHRFIERLGFIHLGTVPNMLKNRFDREDAEIFYISRLNDG